MSTSLVVKLLRTPSTLDGVFGFFYFQMEVALYLGNFRIITIGLKYHVFLKAGIYVNIHSAVD